MSEEIKPLTVGVIPCCALSGRHPESLPRYITVKKHNTDTETDNNDLTIQIDPRSALPWATSICNGGGSGDQFEDHDQITPSASVWV